MPVKWQGGLVTEAVQAAMRRALDQSGEEMRNEAIRLIESPPKTGRIYERRGVSHQASAPGEPPASDTGQLVNSITIKTDPNSLTVQIGTSVEYGQFLEFGTQRMAARPFLRPAMDNMSARVNEIMSRELSSVTRRARRV